MATIPNMITVSTLHIDGTPASLVNQVVGGGVAGPGGIYQSRFQGIIKYVPAKNGLQANVVIPQAAMLGRIFIPEPLVGVSTVTTTVVDDTTTGWTGGN